MHKNIEGNIFKVRLMEFFMLIEVRNKINDVVYRNFLKKIYFKIDPEKVHNRFIKIGKFLGNNWLGKKAVSLAFNYQDKMLEQEILGIKFRNPVGLSAGFDKNAETIEIMSDVGFGFVEVGSVTANASSGNPGKRLWRIPEQKSLRVNFGLNNKGAKEIAEELNGEEFSIPFGISVAKTNSKETVEVKKGIFDYVESLKVFRNIGDYFVLNISCPNSYGGQPFSDAKRYENLLKEVDKLKIKKPIFVKLSPDLSKKEIDKIIEISGKYKISGFVCTNLTKNHKLGSGGLSGKAVSSLSDKLLEYVYGKTKGKFVLIGVGGIFSAEDAYRKIKLGSSLVELVTGMIYQGPALIGEINLGLVKLLKKDGYGNIGEAVGKGVK